jgi:hypothetical protein
MVINGQERKYNTYVPCQGSLLAATWLFDVLPQWSFL